MADTQVEFSKTLQNQLFGFWYMREYCDVKVICRDEEEFPCHRIMLVTASPFFEESFRHDTSVTLKEYPVYAMEQILNFIYTGSIEFTPANIRSIVVAAEKLKLRHQSIVDQLAVEYIYEETEPRDELFNLFAYLMQGSSERTILIQALASHIMIFFKQFKKRQFMKFDVTWWLALLNQRWYLPHGLEVKFISRFHKCKLNRKELHFEEAAIRAMTFDYDNEKYNWRLMVQFRKPAGAHVDADELDQITLPTLHVIVREGASGEMRVFSASRASPFTWTKSHDGPEYLSSMKLVAVGDALYCLGYSSKVLKFHQLNSINYPGIQNQTPPPITHAHLELSATPQDIYLLTFGHPVNGGRKVPFSQDISEADMYKYSIETGIWSSVPLPRIGFCEAATMTAYAGCVYLFVKGGNLGQYPVLYALVGDDFDYEKSDSSRWSKLGPSTMEHHGEKMTCCGYEDKIYLCSSCTGQQPVIERFDLRARVWEAVAPLGPEVDYVHRLIPLENWVWAVGDAVGHDTCCVETYNTYSDTWEPSPFVESIRTLTGPESQVDFLDCVVFKPAENY